MAKSAPKASAAVSFNPEDMVGGGLKDDFRGLITEARYVPWDYDGKIDEPALGVRLTIDERDVESGESLGADPVVQVWSAGSLADFMPSEDGESPNEGEGMDIEPGPYAVKVGKKAALNNNTNFAHLAASISDTVKAKEVEFAFEASLECLEGLDAHWNRVAQKKRSGLVQEDGEKKNRDVLVVTDIYGYREEDSKPAKKGAKATPGKASKAKAAEPEEEESDESDRSPIDQKLDDILKEALGAAKNNTLKKGQLASIVMKAAGTDKDKPKMVKRVTEDDYLMTVDGVTFDTDDNTVTLDE